jgi:hypothetical protein
MGWAVFRFDPKQAAALYPIAFLNEHGQL